MEIWPDLFGRALLMRQWGRIGTEGRRRLDPYPDPGAESNCSFNSGRIRASDACSGNSGSCTGWEMFRELRRRPAIA